MWSEEKGLWPWPLRISLPCQYLFQILNLVSDWLLKLVPRHDRGHTVWYNDDSSMCRHEGEVDSYMEVRFSTAEAWEALLFASGFSFCCLSTLGPLEPGYWFTGYRIVILFLFSVWQMVKQLVKNGANSIWEHSLLDPNQMKSGIRKPNPKDKVQ